MSSETVPDQSEPFGRALPLAQKGVRRRFVIALVILGLIFFVGGALLAPWLYALVRQAADWFNLAADPFQRYVPRAMPLAVFLCLWPLMRFVGLRSPSDIGLVGPRGQWQKFLFAFFAGMLALIMVSGIGLVGGANRLNEHVTISAVLAQLVVLVPGAIAVAVTEEILFRGLVLSMLRRLLSWPAALLASSAIFAVLHFMHRPEFSGPVTWHSGLQLLPFVLSGLVDVRSMLPLGISLFLAGMLLGIAYGRSGSLYFSIGLHAGAIMAIKLHLVFTNEVPETATWLWGSRDLIDGWLAIGVLLVAVAMFAFQAGPADRPMMPAGRGGRLMQRLAASPMPAAFLAYVGFLCAVLLASAGASRWLGGSPDPPDGRPNTERLARHSVRDTRGLHQAAAAAGLITARRLVGVIDVMTRVDDREVAIMGWLADKEGDATPRDVVVFLRGTAVAIGQTSGERPDVTQAIGLKGGTEKHVGFRVLFTCRTGEQPVVVGLSDPKYYLPLKAPPCP